MSRCQHPGRAVGLCHAVVEGGRAQESVYMWGPQRKEWGEGRGEQVRRRGPDWVFIMALLLWYHPCGSSLDPVMNRSPGSLMHS